MGLLTDILKDLPLSANLQEKVRTFEAENAALKTENAILKDDLRQAKAEIQKLEKRLEELTHTPELHEQERAILRYLFRSDVDRDSGSIISSLNFEHPEEARLRLNNLSKLGYVQPPRSRPMPGRIPQYRLTDKGREYVLNNLL
jgi:predicted nuclease with TOPRIM domain